MLGECGDPLKVQSNDSGRIVAPVEPFQHTPAVGSLQRLQRVMTQFRLLEEFAVFLPRPASFKAAMLPDRA